MPQLAKHHRAELVPTREPTRVALGLGLFNRSGKLQPRHELQNLTENAAYSIHGGVLLVGYGLPCQKPNQLTRALRLHFVPGPTQNARSNLDKSGTEHIALLNAPRS